MWNRKPIFGTFAALLFVALPTGARAQTATMDKPIPSFAPISTVAPDTRATALTLISFAEAKQPVVLVFLANRCGVTWQYAEKIAALQKQYGKSGKVAIIGVHSNFEETDAELLTEMKKRKLDFPVLDDKPAQQLATYFGATVTPYFVVLDGNGFLRYKGAFDKMGGSVTEAKREQFLRPALDAVLAGKPVTNKTVRALGCEIARRGTPPATTD